MNLSELKDFAALFCPLVFAKGPGLLTRLTDQTRFSSVANEGTQHRTLEKERPDVLIFRYLPVICPLKGRGVDTAEDDPPPVQF